MLWGGTRIGVYLSPRQGVSLIPLAVLPWVTYLALPVIMNPLLPSTVLLGVAMCIAAATFKKYL